jgi:hypothetical protein
VEGLRGLALRRLQALDQPLGAFAPPAPEELGPLAQPLDVDLGVASAVGGVGDGAQDVAMFAGDAPSQRLLERP